MESSRKTRLRKRALETLLPNFESPEGINPSALKNLYSFLVKLCSNPQWKFKYAEVSNEFDLEFCNEGIKLKFMDIYELSNVLFDNLEARFEQLFSELTENSYSLGLFNAMEVLNLLFRCCMLLLPLLGLSQQNLVHERGQILLKIVRKLMLPGLMRNKGKHAFVFEESVFCDNGCSGSSIEGFSASVEFLEPCNPLCFLKCTMLEVYVDELIAHRQVTRYLKMINSVAATSNVLSSPHSAQGDAWILMEAICYHFIQSFSDKQAFGDFLSRLFCTHEQPFRLPALGITAAVSLFLNPITASAPKYVQAHLISLVSEAIHVKNLKPDRKLTNCFLSAFEKSVILYTRHMSRLQIDGWGSTLISSDGFVYPLFECYISSETKEKVDALVSRLDSSSHEVLDGSFPRMKSDLVATLLRFVKDCQNAYTISCQEEIFTVLSCLVLKASQSYTDKPIRPMEGATLQHLSLLSSLLKLMSVSLIQAIRCVRHSDDSSRLRSLQDFSSCKEYDFILGTITCFKDFDTSLPLQRDLHSLMSSHSTRQIDSKMMFLHFSGLMSLSFATGLDCLVKACLLVNLALLNLFVFEEGNLDALHSLVDSSGDYLSCELPLVRFSETVSDRSSSLVIASRFHKMRSLHSSVVGTKHSENESLCSQALATASHTEAAAWVEEETEETCNGEIFLKCMLQRKEIGGLDDLVDFIECKQGKDYTSWMKNRRRFRKWRSAKTAVLKWERKKKSWKIRKGKTSS